MHINNIREAQQSLAKLMFTRHYDMGSWIEEEEDCGTTLCLGGIACTLSLKSNALQPSPYNLVYKGFRQKLMPAVLLTQKEIESIALDFFGINESDYLGFSPDALDNIFFYGEWPEGLQAIYDFNVDEALYYLEEGSLYNFLLEVWMPQSFFKTLAGYIGLECLIEHGPLWTQPTRDWQAADFVSHNPEAISRFIAIAQQLLNQKA